MKAIIYLLPLLLAFSSPAEDIWPLEIKTKEGGVINIYQPQPESLNGNKLEGRTAFSAKAMAGDELIFGVFWFTATISTDRDSRTASLESIQVKEIKLPGIDDTTKISKLRKFLNAEIPKQNITASLDEIITTIDQEQKLTDAVLKTDAPVIYYKEQTTTLVLIDGEPSLKDDDQIKMKRVINTAFLIVQNPDDKKYYLYAGQLWYSSSSLKEGYQPVSKLPQKLASLDKQLKKDQKEKPAKTEGPPPAIFISTTPAELIQSNGAANFATIDKTNLLYVSNSTDDIFKSIADQKYYVLLSGRWYSSPKLDGTWTYIASDKLPEDFAKIPEGSEKDNVLSSVAGTAASKEAIMDAQVPQTAKVDRKTATCTVKYDGDPKFEKIEGTSMELAMNTSSTVIKSENKFYCVESGVWFVADKATGPWKVSDTRPKEVNKIPASSPAYNTQYVYVYDSTPDVVYVGYTPGYMGCYVYGPTVVYGTGFYYNPWYGPYYYPRPVTYGFSMHYNPWTGWGMGFHYSSGFFSLSIYGGHAGYWGPPYHRPPYYPPYHGGMYGPRGPVFINNGDINIDRSNNIYNKRNGVSTNDVKRGQNNRGNRPSTGTRPSNMDQNRSRAGSSNQVNPNIAGPKNNVYSGKDGSVHQRNDNGNWEQRNGNQWQQNKSSNMDRDYQNRQRSSQYNSNFNNMNRGGGGMRGGGFGGGGGRGRR